MEIYEKAHELGTIIADSDAFKRLNKAKAAQEADGEANLVMLNYNRNRERLIKEASAPDLTEEKMKQLQAEMEKEIEKLRANPAIAEYMAAMDEFNNIMEQVNGIISSYIAPKQEGGCSGDCGSCGGCH